MKSRLVLASSLGIALLVAMLLLVRRGTPLASDVERAAPMPSLVLDTREDEIVAEPRAVLQSPTGERAVAAEPQPTAIDASADVPVAADRHPVVLHGGVRSDDDSAIGLGTVVFLHHEDGEMRRALVVDGRYEIGGLLPGSWRVRCAPEGFRAVEDVLVLSKRDTERQLDFVLARLLVIPVRFVTPSGARLTTEWPRSGQPFGRVVAVATKDPPPKRFPESSGIPTGDGSATYRQTIEELREGESREDRSDGRLTIDAALPLHVSATVRGVVLETRILAAPVDQLVFTIDPSALDALTASFVIRLVDAEANQAPLRASAYLDDRQTSRTLPGPDDQGVLRCADLQPGWYRLTVHVAKRGPFLLNFHLSPGVDKDLGTHSITAGTRLTGRMLASGDEPIQSWMRLHSVQEPSPLDSQFIFLGKVDDAGHFEAKLGPGRWIVEFGGGDEKKDEDDVFPTIPPRGPRLGAALREYDSTRGPYENEIVHLVPTTTVRLVPGAELGAHASFKVWNAEGTVALRNGWLDRLPETVRLVPGTYRLQIRDALGKQIREDEIVVGTEPIELEIGR